MASLLIRNARTLTMCDGAPDRLQPTPPGPRRGRELGMLGIIPSADVLVRDGIIAEVRPGGTPAGAAGGDLAELDARGRVLMPGFVDCHTHACWAGSRIEEWERKLAGASYLDILASGGGIMSTVRAVREATDGELACDLIGRVDQMLRLGTTTAEVKSGYGLSTEHELRMLGAIVRASDYCSCQLSPTALIGHAIEGEADAARAFVEATLGPTLDGVHSRFPGITIDAYCEKGAWSLDDTVRLLRRAVSLGHPVRVHADQFNALGMVEQAVAIGAVSVDHLEATPEESLRALAKSQSFGVMLPACGFHLDGRYANGRGFLDAGGLLAIATNFNPGSAPCPSMAMVIALAVRHLRLSPAEAIGAATLNPARLLGYTDRGHIAPGARADLLLLRHSDERALAYEFGDNPVETVFVGGELMTG